MSELSLGKLPQPAILTMEDAVAVWVRHLDQRDAAVAEGERLAMEALEARCTEIARALTDHLMRHEGVAVPMVAWRIDEVQNMGHDGIGVPESYIAYLGLKPVMGDGGDEASYRTYQALHLGGLRPEHCTEDHMPDDWTAWHHSSRGTRFPTFVAALTYAQTGRK